MENDQASHCGLVRRQEFLITIPERVGLFTAFIISQLIYLFVIPSRSMDPTLEVGDVLVVENKVTSRAMKDNNRKGDIVLFHPPSRLQQIV
mmetsp:Transcript_15895/g.23073  ORF Transcript_15895/g.23073 Transcript_15895/m.23073 type:complete len:91 (-) Transcript_15895:671-943(-)